MKKDEYYSGPTGMSICLFAFSKGSKFIDTFFTLMPGRRHLPFLQWFHHTTTFLYIWHSYSVGNGALTFAAKLNYSVHAVMYFYLALTGIGSKDLARPFAKYITLLQIAQMVTGMFLMNIVTEKYKEYSLGRAESAPTEKLEK
jgi:elongation of very long chain fatty acids protein 6